MHGVKYMQQDCTEIISWTLCAISGLCHFLNSSFPHDYSCVTLICLLLYVYSPLEGAAGGLALLLCGLFYSSVFVPLYPSGHIFVTGVYLRVEYVMSSEYTIVRVRIFTAIPYLRLA